jgi:hypothetical protein
VDNSVDKGLLTRRKRSNDAGFNKLHNEKAKMKVFKIKDMHMHQI